jgi:TolB protein
MAVLLLASLLVASPAQAAFPGENGRIVFYSLRDGNGEIYSANPDGSDPVNLTNNPAFDATPAVSADGSKIAFLSDREAGSHLWVMGTDGSNPTMVSGGCVPAYFAWSPDGSRIAFTDICFDDIFVINVDGTGLTGLATTANFERFPSWSPDGARIAYSRFNGAEDDIWVMDADGSDQTDITNDPADELHPDWAPDGSRVVYSRDGELAAINPDGSGQANLTSTPGEAEYFPTWSPDGTRIAFQSCAARCDISTMAIDGTDRVNLTGASNSDNLVPDWQPLAPSTGTLVITSDTTLTKDHFGSIVIDADDVTLDCAGFRVVGPSSDPTVQEGIVVAHRSGVTIRNCVVQGFPRGILLDSSTATTVVGNRLEGNSDYGIFLFDADGNTLVRNTATGNAGSGFGGSDFDRNVFEHNRATANGGSGFDMTRSSHNTFEGNVVMANAGHGFKIFDDTDRNVFSRNRANGNGMTGFLMYGGFDENQQQQLQPPDHNTFAGNQAIGNGEGGLYLLEDSTANLVTGNRVLRNGEFGIALIAALDNLVAKNGACGNAIWDAFQEGGSGNRWRANIFCTESGI